MPRGAGRRKSSTGGGGGGDLPSFDEQQESCPMCKRVKYLSPDMKIMVSPCGKKFCTNCVNRHFPKAKGPCPVCKIDVRRQQFTLQTFEDVTVQKEMLIRTKVTKDLNKRREDFPDLRSYNDFLEYVEDCVFNLANNIDTERVMDEIAKFKEENKEVIERNHKKEKEAEERFKDKMLQEQRMREEIQRYYRDMEKREQDLKRTEQEKLIKDLMQSKGNAKDLVSKHEAESSRMASELESKAFIIKDDLDNVDMTVDSDLEEQTEAEFLRAQMLSLGGAANGGDSKANVGGVGSLSSASSRPEPYIYEHRPLAHVDLEGPAPLTVEALRKGGFLSFVDLCSSINRASAIGAVSGSGRSASGPSGAMEAVQKAAGGMVSELACSRAIYDAYNGLFAVPAQR
eukprot:Nk52_evm7s213 gene=Nk52_evmTU7s213